MSNASNNKFTNIKNVCGTRPTALLIHHYKRAELIRTQMYIDPEKIKLGKYKMKLRSSTLLSRPTGIKTGWGENYITFTLRTKTINGVAP